MAGNHTNTKTSSGKLNWFQFSLLSILFYVLVSLLMLSLLNFHSVWQTVLQSITGSTDQSALQPYTDDLLAFMGKLNTPVLMIFWAAFGVLVFSIIWVVQNVIFTAGKEVEESHYLKGGVASEPGYWHRAMASNLWVVVVAILWIAYAALYLTFLLPLASKLFYVGLFDPSIGRQLLDITVAVLINAAALFLFWNIQLAMTATWRKVRG